MRSPADDDADDGHDVIAALRRRGELWEPAPGLVALRGAPLALLREIEEAIAALCAAETDDEWRVPAALPLAVLERGGYFASFPQWLSLATHLGGDAAALEAVAASAEPAREAARVAAPASAALPPAVCWHVYAALAGTTLAGPRLVTAQCTCWRREEAGFAPLERGWAFTMREIVCVGSAGDCVAFRDRTLAAARGFAESLGLRFTVEAAEDPFFAPTARGRRLVQRLRGLKQELRLAAGPRHAVAAASFNLHERFFGDAFDIRLADGSPAHSACVAFGIERWVLALLRRWGSPALPPLGARSGVTP